MTALDFIRWGLTALSAALGAAMIIANTDAVLGAFLHGGRARLVPFVGGLALAAALVLCPFAGTTTWAWAPLLLDPGSVPALVAAAISIRRSRQKDAPETSEVSQLPPR